MAERPVALYAIRRGRSQASPFPGMRRKPPVATCCMRIAEDTSMPGYGAIASTHALVWWCVEFYRAEPLWKRPAYLALIVATVTCMALTAATIITRSCVGAL